MQESEIQENDLQFRRLALWLNFWKMMAIFFVALIIVIFVTVYISEKYFKRVELDHQLEAKRQENITYYIKYAHENNQPIPASLVEQLFLRGSQQSSNKQAVHNIQKNLTITNEVASTAPPVTNTVNNTPPASAPSAISADSVTVSGSATTGLASYYADKFQGRPTASGEAFDNNAFTAAHRTIAFGTRLKISHTKTGASVIVKVNDRGPFVKDKIIDLSKAAAEKLGIIKAGHGEVTIEKVASQHASNATTASANIYKN